MKVIFFIFSSSLCWANGLEYTIQGKKIQFYDQNDLRITSSKKCQLSIDKKSCQNFKFLSKISTVPKKRTAANTANPGSLICEDQIDGTSVIGSDVNLNQRSFCYLSKQSLYIDNGTLTYWAEKNDGFYDKPDTFNFGR